MTMRLFLCISLLIFLTSCTGVSTPMWMTPADQQLFVQGMDEFEIKEEEPEAFDMLQDRFPESPWSAKAHTIQTLLDTIENQRKVIQELKKCQKVNGKKNQKLLQQIASLETDLETLESERTKLRQLLIDLEQRKR